MATATKKRTPRSAHSIREVDDVDALRAQIDQYEHLFAEIETFTGLIREQEETLADAEVEYLRAKEELNRAKQNVSLARDARDGTKHALFVFLRPGPAKILPLFDRMEKADDIVHGAHSSQWRSEPVTALRLSIPATQLLTAADVLFVGQLQDRVMDDSEDWWKRIEGMTAPVAMAVVDRLNDFIAESTGGAK